MDDFGDSEMRLFLERLPTELTYSEMAAAARQRFGEARAWPREKIRAFWLSVHPLRPGRRPVIELAADIREFIDDRMGRRSLDQLVDELAVAFGSRAPSRSAIGRYWQRMARAVKRR